MIANEGAREACVAGEVYGVLARMFACGPTEQSYGELVRVAQLLACDEFAPEGIDVAAADAAFEARFVVPGGKAYVPLSENCIALAGDRPAPAGEVGLPPRITWGACTGSRSAHVAECYRAVGFSPDAVRAAAPAAAALRDDALAVELAFMAYLAACQAWALDGEGADGAILSEAAAASAEQARAWQERFLHDHLLCWVGKAAAVMARTGDDLYTRAALLTEAWCKFDIERVTAQA